QVAAFADHHVVVDKPTGARRAAAGVTRSDVRLIDGDDRLAELARMLGGNDSLTARQHAAELLDDARRGRDQPASGDRVNGRTPRQNKLKSQSRPRGGSDTRRGRVAP